MTNQKDRLPPTLGMEVEDMAVIVCAWCGNSRPIRHGYASQSLAAENWSREVIRGVLTCGSCQKHTVFELKGDAIQFLPGRLFLEDIVANVPDTVKVLVAEATLCFYGMGFRGTVGMCRSAVEEALDQKGATGGDLYAKIENAKQNKLLGDEEISQAQGARLIGRDALHRNRHVTQTEAMLALNSTVQLVNHIARQTSRLAS